MRFRALQILATLLLALALLPSKLLAQTRYRGMQVSPRVSQEDIQVLGSWKANIARYQLYWAEASSATESEYFEWLDGELDRLEALLPTFAAANIRVLVVLQSPPGGLASLKPKMYRMFKEAWAQTAFFEAWNRIASRFVSNTTILGYTLINEPAADPKYIPESLLDLNELYLEAAQRIRAIDPGPEHVLILLPIYGDQGKLKYLKLLPASIVGVDYATHFYYPPSINQSENAGAYPAKGLNKSKLNARLAGARKFSTSLKTLRPSARFWLTEFSACRWAKKNGAYYYLKDAISIFEKNSWSWIYHAFREAHKWDVELSTNKSSLVKPATPTSRQKLLLKYFGKNS